MYEPVKPVLLQHNTDLVFHILLQNHFKVLHVGEDVSSEMMANESNALQYIAGYVCTHLHKKIERESHDLKEEMILCLVEFVKSKTAEDQRTGEGWIDFIDRGGLCHVKETIIQLFYALENQVRDVLMSLEWPSPSCKVDVIKKVIT